MSDIGYNLQDTESLEQDGNGLTPDRKIISRLSAGEEAMQPYAARDRTSSARYMDPSQQSSTLYGVSVDDPLNSYEDRAIGNVPYVATNIRTKAAAMSFGDPDWYVESRKPETVPLVKAFLSHMWVSRKWKRLTEKALYKRCIMGMGVVAYRWDKKSGPELEHVHVADLIVDPFVTEWHDLRFAGRKIRMPRDEALARWPDKADAIGHDVDTTEDSATDYRRVQAIDIKLYWDLTTEAAFFGKTLLYKTPNHYKRVPLLFMEGDYDPRPGREFPGGDFDSVVGIQELRIRLNDVINNQAQHGGCLTLYNPDAFSANARRELEMGREQGLLACDDMENAVTRIPAEPLSDALIQADARMEAAMDAAQGTNQYMRGVVTQDPKFATQVGALNNLAGARGNVQRLEYEAFLNEVARCVLTMALLFAQPESEDEMMLMDAIQAVTNITAVEQSTSYKEPAQETMLAAQDIQLLAPLAPMIGLNMQALVEDYLRARGKRDIARYFQQQPAQPGVGMPPGMPPGGVPGAPAPGPGASTAPPPGAPGVPPGGPGIPPGAQAAGAASPQQAMMPMPIGGGGVR